MKNIVAALFGVSLQFLIIFGAHAANIIDLQFNDYGNNPADRADFNAFGGNYSLWDSNFQTAGGYLNVDMSTKVLGRVGFEWVGGTLDASKDLVLESTFQMLDPSYDNVSRGSAFIEAYDGTNELSFYITSHGLKVLTTAGYETIAIDLGHLNNYRISSAGNSNTYNLYLNNSLFHTWLAPSTVFNGFHIGVGGAVWDPSGPGVDAKYDFITLSQSASPVPSPSTLSLFLLGIILIIKKEISLTISSSGQQKAPLVPRSAFCCP